VVGRTRILSSAAGLFLAAVLGAGLALGGAALFGGFDGGTKTVRVVGGASSFDSEPRVGDFVSGKRLSIAEVYRRSAPGVVQITSTSVVEVPQDPLFGNPFGPSEQTQQALGSGFVIDKAGHIITNEHVVEGARSIEVSFSNNDSMKARLVGKDPSTDIAVLKVDARSRALTPLAFGNSDGIRVGDSVVAIGNPFGYDRTVTAGIISAIGRQITAPNSFTIDHVIQTDAAINHGNSGGPLIDAQGRVIGVNSQIPTGNTGQQGNVGIGFAVPSNTVREVVSQLMKNGKVEHPYIGVTAVPITPELARVFRFPVDKGLIVQRVEPGSGAAKAGLRAGTTEVVVAGQSYVLGGDVIVKADDASLSSLDQLRDRLVGKKPGDKLKLEIYRDGNKKAIEVKLGRQPSSPPNG
jgi:putative serine protease PepD